MKRIFSLGFLTLTVACLTLSLANRPAAAQTTKMGGSVQDEIKKLEQERNQAILHGDTAALDRMSASNYTVINARGDLLTKAQIVEGFKSGSIKYESRELSDLDVRLYGNTAVVTGRVTQKATENGKDNSGEFRFTRVYVKEKGKWVSASTQITPIAK